MKEEVILIRCSRDVKKAFKLFIAKRGFRTYEDALVYLLQQAGEPVVVVEGRIY